MIVSSDKKPLGYWKDIENRKRELRPVIEKLGHFPTFEELNKNGYKSLAAGINKNSGFNKLREQMGYDLTRKPEGYWQNPQNRKRVLLEITKELGHFPSTVELIKRGYGGLVNAIREYDGGYTKFAEELGYNSRKPSGYWKVYTNAEKKTKELIKKLGHYPTRKEFEDNDYSGLSNAIKTFYGGNAKFKQRIGYTKEDYYERLKKIENVKEELLKLKNSLGHFPTSTELIKEDKFSLLHAIRKYHGGYKKLRNEMGYSNNRNNWKILETRSEFIKNFLKENGRLPSYEELRKISGLEGAIQKYDGGYRKFKEKLGLEVRKPAIKWNLEEIKLKIKELTEELGHFPSTVDLGKLGYKDLRNSIINHYGSYLKFREDFGQVLEVTPTHYWENKENVKKKMNEIIEKLGHYPSTTELDKLGYAYMGSSISRFHGGYNNFREWMGYKSETLRNSWKNKEYVVNEVRNLIKELGRFPTSKDFVNMGKGGLLGVIHKNYGGLNEFRVIFGYDKFTPRNYWKNIENIKEKFGLIVKELGHFPTSTELSKLGHHSLLISIGKQFGGYFQFRKEMEQELIKKENNYWKSWGNLEKEIKEPVAEFFVKNNRLPSYIELGKITSTSAAASVTKNFGGLNMVYARLGYPNSKLTDENFIALIDNDEHLREIVKVVGNDPVTLADILAIRYADTMQRKDLAKFFEERPGLRKYMGKFATGINGWEDYENLAKHTLPFDKEDKIRSILVKKGIEYFLKDLGAKPADEEIQLKINQLEEKLFSMD